MSFHIGNRVKLVGSTHAYVRNLGRIGTITSIDGQIYRVQFEHDNDDLGTYDTAYASDLAIAGFNGTVTDKLAAIEALVAEIKAILGQ